jgi:rSAM/selenodomain-associated transferase 2
MISVIIPTYNEERTIALTIDRLRRLGGTDIKEIIVVDGGSTDDTVAAAEGAGAHLLRDQVKGRASQMNAGAAVAGGSILYFIHADCVPPARFTTDILDSVAGNSVAGCFRLEFDRKHWFLRFNCWFTRFNFTPFHYGDQSLFVTKKAFDSCAGFNDKLMIMEDNDMIKRLKRLGKFKVLNKRIITSARKYVENGMYKMQGVFFLIYFMYQLGCPQEMLIRTYRKLINQDKV